MKQSVAAALALGASFMLFIAAAAELITAGKEPPISRRPPLLAAMSSATIPTSGHPVWAAGPDYIAQYPQEYAFFKTAFDQANRNLYAAERDSAFSIFAQRVEALQNGGAKISLGGMLALLIYEGAARLVHYNSLCSENDYYKDVSGCWNYPEARYSYQVGLGAVHTSNFHPCKDRFWTGTQRKEFAQLASQAGFTPTAEQIASVVAELHQFCPATQPQAVDYYILRAHDLGIPKDGKDNPLASAGKYPFFTPSLSLAFFFSKLEAQPSQLISDERTICIWGKKGDEAKSRYCKAPYQVKVLAQWNQFRAKAGSRQVVLASFQGLDDGTSSVLVPFLLYAGGRYMPLTRGVIDPSMLNFTQNDLLSAGAVKPGSARVTNAIQQSVLNTFKDFEVYRKSIKVGHFTVTRVSVIHFGGGISDPVFKVVGSGVPKGFEPQDDLAVAGTAGYPDRDLASKITITDQDITDFYNQNRAQFNVPETRYHILQIVVTGHKDPQIRNRKGDDAVTDIEARRKAEALLDRLKRGADFAQLAMDYSEDYLTTPIGGDLGYIPESALSQSDPALKETVLTMTPGQLSNVIALRESYRILKLVAREAAGQRELSDPAVQYSIRESLRNFACSKLTPAQAREARSLALGLIPKVMPRVSSWPETEGQAIILGSPEYQSLTCFDLRRDGDTEVSLELRVPFTSPKGKRNEYGVAPQFSANVFLFGRYERGTAHLNTLLSSLSISKEGDAWTYPDLSGSTRLLGAADIAGNGTAELVVANVGGAADNWIRVYKLTAAGLVLICEIRNYWTMGDY
jgi:hypothetical protein